MGEATTLNNIGAVYDDLGDKRKALDYYEQALSLSFQVGDRW
jgi:tetratricopeptide (TPR) repeat protein